MRFTLLLIFAGLVFASPTGCSSKEDSSINAPEAASAAENAADPSAPSAAQSQSTTAAISAAQNSLKSGAIDEAAAQLAQMQVQGSVFNTQQAKDYRQALSEAYDRAIEAAQRGDPRGQAALQLLRAASPK
ncbi:MAG: hypothetical protein AB1813_28425 [Verrucomicrobiota bacterium]